MAVVNEIEFQGTERRSWRRPDLEDFYRAFGWEGPTTWDGLSRDRKMRVKEHFLVTTGTDSNPPENFGQLKLPVVNPNTGRLNVNALNNADSVLSGGRGGIEGVSRVRKRLDRKVNRLQRENFGIGNSRGDIFGM